jgi:hypothetical protein
MKFFSKLSVKSFSIMILSIIVLASAIGVYLFYNNPKIKFILLANNEYKSFVSVLNKVANNELETISKDNTLSLSGDVSFNLSLNYDMFGNTYNSIVDIINKLNINYEYASDKDGVNTYLKLDSNIDNKHFIDVEEYQMSDKRYTYYNDIFDKYIESNSIEYINKNSNQVEDLEYLINKLKSSFFASIKLTDFKIENKKITVNNESINTNKITFTLNDKRMKEVIKAVLIDIRDDKKCMSILKELNGEENIDELINDSINSIDKDTLLAKDLAIDMYVKDNAVKELDVFNGDIKTIQYLSYNNIGLTKQLTMIDDVGNTYDFKFEQKSPNDISCTVSLGDGTVVIGSDIVNSTNSSIENKTWNNDLKIVSDLSVSNIKMGNLTININTTANVGGVVKTINPNNVIKESDLTEEDRNTISNKLVEKIIDALPTDLIGSMSTNPSEVY